MYYTLDVAGFIWLVFGPSLRAALAEAEYIRDEPFPTFSV